MWKTNEELKNINMEKEKRNFEIDYKFDWSYEATLAKIREDLDALEKLGCTEIEIESEDNYGSISVVYTAICNRMETDEEFMARVKQKKDLEDRNKEYELKLLNKLKSKYEPK